MHTLGLLNAPIQSEAVIEISESDFDTILGEIKTLAKFPLRFGQWVPETVETVVEEKMEIFDNNILKYHKWCTE